MGLAALGKEDKSNQDDLLSINENGEINLDFNKINQIYTKANIFRVD